MTDAKLAEWIPDFFDNTLFQFNASLKNPEIQGVFGSFMFNIQNYIRMPYIIAGLFWDGWVAGKADAVARLEVLGSEAIMEKDSEEEVRIRKRRGEIVNDTTTPMVFPYTHSASTPEIVKELDPKRHEIIASLFPMQVVGAWSAFETLTGDLWVKAVNLKPTILARLSGGGKRIGKLLASQGGAKPTSGDGDQDRDCTLSLSAIDKITRGTFNLSGCMGDVLVSSKQVAFTSLREIRIAYSRAFPDNESGVKPDAIDAALVDKQLDGLSLVRNLLVHKSGQADDEYVEKRKGTPNAPEVEKGNLLRLDGQQAKSFVNVATQGAMNLTKGVDQWITNTSSAKLMK